METLPTVESRPGSGSPADTVPLFGLRLSRMSYSRTLDWLDSNVLQRAGSRACVFSANVDQLVRYRRSAGFRQAYGTADLIVPDGMPVVWAARLLGRPVAERVTGIDLMHGLCHLAARAQRRCFLLGSEVDVARAAAQNLGHLFPGLVVGGWHDGYFSADAPVVAAVNAARPDLLFVGMGSPRQEFWLQRNFGRLSCRLALPVGGAFEVIAGRKKRAPRLAQRSGMEWAWRLLQDPRRLGRRYLIDDLEFLALVFAELRSRRGHLPALWSR
jgi:N-acetylglucosaminyldiphosphoundecaprenol N-acetyl-beta-D-mannosaminyltransferase